MIKCSHCDKEFIKTGNTQKFCSKNCRDLAWAKNNRAKKNKSAAKTKALRYSKGLGKYKGPKTQEIESWILELKSKPCVDCGNCFESCCMDFDHILGEKKYNIGSMVAHSYSKSSIEEELIKCELVCSNCHRIRTRNRKLNTSKFKNMTKEEIDTYFKENV